MLPEIQHTRELFFPVVPGSKLSYDQGLTIRQHPSGMEIFMVKSNPGVYLNAYGTPVPEALAQEAGFDVVKNAKEKRRREMLSRAMTEIEAQLRQDEDTVLDVGQVLLERDGFKVIDLNLGRAQVVDPEGNKLLPVPVPHMQAKALLDKLVPASSAE